MFIKYRKNISVDEAMEIVEELLPHYGGSDTYNNNGIISIYLREQSNLFQTTEIYNFIMDGCTYDGDDGYRDKRTLTGYINIIFYGGMLHIYSWYETFIDEIEENTYDENIEELEEIIGLILANENFERLGE